MVVVVLLIGERVGNQGNLVDAWNDFGEVACNAHCMADEDCNFAYCEDSHLADHNKDRGRTQCTHARREPFSFTPMGGQFDFVCLPATYVW